MKPHQIQPGAVYHLIPRFVGSEWFIRTDVERRFYLRCFGAALKTSDWRCFSYAVMSNHIHIAVVAGMTPLYDWLREPHREFAQWINQCHDRIGAVFVRGPNNRGVNPERIERLIAYIDRNPIRAGVVARARDTNWTSHRAYAGLDEAPSWLDMDLGLLLTRSCSGIELAARVEASTVARADLDEVHLQLARPGRPRLVPAERQVAIHRELTQLTAPERDRPVC